MKTQFLEASGSMNHGRFLILEFEPSDWDVESKVSSGSVLASAGFWTWRPLFALIDLVTCEGALFDGRGVARHDLDSRRIWVCPMYEPTLEWLYRQKPVALPLPGVVELDVPGELYGHRRDGIGRTVCRTCGAPTREPRT
jgi:hypothetical protein